MRRRVLFNGFQVLAGLSLLGAATFFGACTTEPVNSLAGSWHVVDINGSLQLPTPGLTQILLELHPDSTWIQYFNGATTPYDQGVWTVGADGKVSLTAATLYGQGFIQDGKLTIEWGLLEVYHYRRGQQ